MPRPKKEMRRNLKKLDVDKFKARVDELCKGWGPAECLAILDIKTKTAKFNQIITTALDEQVPLRRVTVRPSWLIWWNEDLTKKKTSVNKLFKKHHDTPASNIIKMEYQEERRLYKAAIRQAKKECW